MQIRSITVSRSMSWGPYSKYKASLDMTADLEPGEDAEQMAQELAAACREFLYIEQKAQTRRELLEDAMTAEALNRAEKNAEYR